MSDIQVRFATLKDAPDVAQLHLIAAMTLYEDQVPMASAKDSTAHMWLDNPFKGKQASWWHKLFMTHPPIEERIAALQNAQV